MCINSGSIQQIDHILLQLEGMYKAAHAAIRENPAPLEKKEKSTTVEQKRFTAKRRTLLDRKNRVKNRKAYLLHLKQQEAKE
jgi:hypothetical protein